LLRSDNATEPQVRAVDALVLQGLRPLLAKRGATAGAVRD
jgi:hypothetical protein